jgi:DNA invertase Pin-like site-specific DNA recombinase
VISLQDLVTFLGELHGKGVDLYLHQQGIDTTTPAGKMMFQMMGVFAEFERTMIQERIHGGLGRARAKGKALGRPKTLTPKQAAQICTLRADGMSFRKIAQQTKQSLGAVQRALDAE